jgi:protein-arginine kinase activator protein McsA
MFKTIRFKMKLKAVTRAKKREIKNHNFEAAALLRDQEKAILKQIDKLKSQQNK